MSVRLKETEAWRLPAVLESLGFQVHSLLAAISDSRLGVKTETVEDAKKRFSRQ